MAKKIIDVPITAGGLEITYTALTSTGDRTRFSTAIYSPDELEDAHERSTVELTKDEIEDIKEAYKTSKENGEKSVFGFLLTASDMAIHTDFNLLAKWFLGYIDLIPKPMFLVEVDMHDTLGNLRPAHVWKNNKHGSVTPYLDADTPMIEYNYEEFSEEEADKIVEGLHALKARKVPLYKD